ncbi:MAG: pyruvate, phosphate dikinase [Dehalococcoidia bacterium]|nr:MAG: pyruvate, phosphate dikinase [Dehalococcoidia bacterium]
MSEKYVYLFHEGHKDQKDLLGGKGANLAEMTNLGLPVPPGFTITTVACNAYTQAGMQFPAGLMDQVREALATVEKAAGKKLGNPATPLLVSVRSGAKFSMPGMMDTVLNLGLNESTLRGLVDATGDERFAYDAYRRFIMMFSDIVLELDRKKFDAIFDQTKESSGVKEDWQLSAAALKDVVAKFKQLVKGETGKPFPDEPMAQLELAIRAVFNSWNNERAFHYREIEKIAHDLGTAVNVQTMVFGNMGAHSGTGVAFTRDASTGEKRISGEYLINAQGEDVVAGIRTPNDIAQLERDNPPLYRQFADICNTLEQHYREMMDVEFTFEKGRLYFLQCRVAKRAARSAVKIAVDMANEGLITRAEALQRLPAERLDELLHPQLDPRVKTIPMSEASRQLSGVLASKPAAIWFEGDEVKTIAADAWRAMSAEERAAANAGALSKSAHFVEVAKGLAASPGAASGAAVFDSEEAARRGKGGQAVVLVREETSPDDVQGMHESQGILTERGGLSSHAALVARGFGKPCVAGCEAISVNEEARSFSIDSVTVESEQTLTIDGTAGRVLLGAIPTIPPVIFPEFNQYLAWADEAARLYVRTNADTPEDAAQAVEYGARGIGLCRTEHMFLKKERLPAVRQMLLAAADAKRLEADAAGNRKELESASGEKRKRLEERLADVMEQMKGPMGQYTGALAEILPMQQGDFEAIFRIMAGKPVTVRLIDPPMHEFLPDHDELLEDVTRLRITSPGSAELREREAMLASVNAVREQNPMLGLRGCRLALLYPEIPTMQVQAIFRAAIKLAREGVEVLPEVMIPLVGFDSELATLRELLETTARKEMDAAGVQVNYQFGTMIELPRAALTAGRIAKTAEFFSFGTNDLTQTTLGCSRDDAEGKFLAKYLEIGILKDNPFETIDQEGVGSLMKTAVASGRESRPGLKTGICGEHGGDPRSVEFCHQIGLDYVSCSPFRVPIARLAAAQAAIEAGAERDK